MASVGRFGPYVKHGSEFRSLEADDDVYAIGLERALALLAAPKQSRRRQSAARTVLRELGRARGQRRGGEAARGSLRAVRDRRRRRTRRCRRAPTRRRSACARRSNCWRARAAAGAEEEAGPARAAGGGSARRSAAAERRRTQPARRQAGRSAKQRPRHIGMHRCRRRSAAAAHDSRARRRPRGCEAAWQAASRGVPVTLHEMRPVRATEVHQTDRLAELVCSNSLRSDKLDNAVGLLKEEMRRLGFARHADRRRGARAGRARRWRSIASGSPSG